MIGQQNEIIRRAKIIRIYWKSYESKERRTPFPSLWHISNFRTTCLSMSSDIFNSFWRKRTITCGGEAFQEISDSTSRLTWNPFGSLRTIFSCNQGSTSDIDAYQQRHRINRRLAVLFRILGTQTHIVAQKLLASGAIRLARLTGKLFPVYTLSLWRTTVGLTVQEPYRRRWRARTV